MGLTWEHRLALWLPRPLVFGAFLIAVCFSVVYLGFQWFFDFHVDRATFGIVLFIAWVLIAPRYVLAPLDRQQNGLEVPLSDRHEREVRALHVPRDKIPRSRFAGSAGILAYAGLWELLMVAQGSDPVTHWIRLHDGSAPMALMLLLGWFAGRLSYFVSAGFYATPRVRRSLTSIF